MAKRVRAGGRPFVKGQPVPGRHAPWKKGDPSPNPSGRPKVAAEVVLYARERSIPALKVLDAIMHDTRCTPGVRVAAACALLDRAWGRPHQAVSIGDDIGQMSDAALMAELKAALV